MSSSVNILVIEDAPADFQLLLLHLRRHGMAANGHRVASRQELEAALERGGWDIVLADHNVPGMEFTEVLAFVQHRRPELPVMLVSGSIGEERAVELLKQGVSDFVLKDGLARLVPSIERSLREARQRWQRQQAENALHESEQRYRLLADNADDFVLLNHVDGRRLYVSPSYYRVTGWTPGNSRRPLGER